MGIKVEGNRHVLSGYIFTNYYSGDQYVEVLSDKKEDDFDGYSDDYYPLADYAKDFFSGSKVNVCYYVSDKEISLEDVQSEYILKTLGLCEADCKHHYSEITGYLYSTEEFIVGGHNLLSMLTRHEGEYINLVVEIVE